MPDEYRYHERFVTAVEHLVSALYDLGKADASTPLGAIEILSNEIKCGAEGIANALYEIARAMRERRGQDD